MIEFKPKEKSLFEELIERINEYMYEGPKLLPQHYFVVWGALDDLRSNLTCSDDSGFAYSDEFLAECLDGEGNKTFLEVMVGFLYYHMRDEDDAFNYDFYCEVVGSVGQVSSLLSYYDGGWVEC